MATDGQPVVLTQGQPVVLGQPAVLKQGQIFKRSTGLHKAWNERWAVLTAQELHPRARRTGFIVWIPGGYRERIIHIV